MPKVRQQLWKLHIFKTKKIAQKNPHGIMNAVLTTLSIYWCVLRKCMVFFRRNVFFFVTGPRLQISCRIPINGSSLLKLLCSKTKAEMFFFSGKHTKNDRKTLFLFEKNFHPLKGHLQQTSLQNFIAVLTGCLVFISLWDWKRFIVF